MANCPCPQCSMVRCPCGCGNLVYQREAEYIAARIAEDRQRAEGQYRVVTDEQEAAAYQVRIGDTIRVQRPMEFRAAAYVIGIDVAAPPNWNQESVERSYDLLRSLLPEFERSLFERQHTLKVQTQSSRLYVIVEDSQTRIFLRGEPIALACLQLTIPAPPYDRMIAEYLLLKNDEALYLRTANVQPPIRLPTEPTRRRWFQPWSAPW